MRKVSEIIKNAPLIEYRVKKCQVVLQPFPTLLNTHLPSPHCLYIPSTYEHVGYICKQWWKSLLGSEILKNSLAHIQRNEL